MAICRGLIIMVMVFKRQKVVGKVGKTGRQEGHDEDTESRQEKNFCKEF